MFDGSVLVVAKTSPLQNKTEQWRERDGVSIVRILRKIQDRYKRFRIAVLINGYPLPSRDWGKTRAKAGDLINIVVAPTWSGAPLKQLAGFGLGAGALGAAWLLSRTGNSNKQQSALTTSSIAPPPESPPEPPQAPIDNYGGPSDTVMPALMGIENTFNNWGPIPCIYGEDIPVFPVKVASEYFLTIGSEQWMFVVLTCGIGPGDIEDVKIGDTPIEDLVAQGLVKWEKREGKPGDINTPLTIYTKDVNSVSPGATLAYNTVQSSTMGQSASEISIDIIFPNGLYKTDQGATTFIRFNDSMGNPSGSTISSAYNPAGYNPYAAHTCSFLIEYRLHGSSDPWVSRNLSVTDNTPAQKVVSDTWTVAEGIYDVRITRTTSDAVIDSNEVITNATYTQTIYHHYYPTQNCTWSAVKSIKSAAPIADILDKNGNKYPITLIALKIKASLLTNGTLKQLSCKFTRWLPQYNGSTWSAPAATANPAWAFADVVCGYINDSRLDHSYVDADELLDFATFCTEKGFTYNRPITSFTTMEELLEEIARHGRASSNQIDGVWTVVQDKVKSTMVQIFTPALCRNFTWSAENPNYPHGVKMKFRNPDVDWEVDERTVYADGYNENNATDFETIEMAGLASSTAAWKLGRHYLAVGEQRQIKYEFDIDRQNLVCHRGMLVGLNYDCSFDGLGKGELISAVTDDGVNITSITLDNPVVMATGETYGILIRLEDHTFVTRQVNTVDGEQYELTFTTPIPLTDPVLPTRGMAVAFGYLGQEVTQCLVDSIQHLDDYNAHITLVEYAPNVFNADAGAIPAYTPNVNRRHEAKLPVITPPTILGLVSDETVIQVTASQYISRIQVSLAPPESAGVGFVQAQYRLSGTTDWLTNFSGTLTNTLYITGVRDGESYDVRVKYQSNIYPGLSSDWTTVEGHTVVGQSTPPPDVPVFERQNKIAFVKYDANSGVIVPVDHYGFEYRWAQGKTVISWDNMTLLGSVTTSTVVNLELLPMGDLVLAAKAVDKSGNRSENAAFIYTNIEGSFIENQYIEISQSPTWSGTKTNFTQVGNELWADQSADLFWDESGSIFWGANPSSSFYGIGYLSAMYEWTYTPPADLAKPYRLYVKTTSDGTPSGTPLIDADVYTVQYKRNSQTRFWLEDTSLPFWGGSTDPFYTEDAATDVWLPMPQEGLDGAHEEYSFRIICLASSARRPKLLEGIGNLLDVADVTESGTLVTAAPSGTAVTLTKTYREIRGVQVTLQRDSVNYPDARSADAEWTTDPTDPITIRVYDASGTVVAGKVAYDIKGV